MNINEKPPQALALPVVVVATLANSAALHDELPQRLSFEVPVEPSSLTATVMLGANELLAPRTFLDDVAGSLALRIVDGGPPTLLWGSPLTPLAAASCVPLVPG